MTRKFNEENERLKRRYMVYLKEAKGQDEKSLDKVAAALVKFEESTKFKPFKKFHIEQATKFKTFLSDTKNTKTGEPLSYSTQDSILRLTKAFFFWLAGQPGYRSRISYADVEYFNNNRKSARIAHTQRNFEYPSLEQIFHAFQAMPNRTDFEKRDKAMFSFFMLTGARDGAMASLRLGNINLFDGCVYQDAREVKTKFAKTFTSYFLPVDEAYLDCFEAWVNYLRKGLLFSDGDALFPKAERRLIEGQFKYDRLTREPYAGSAKMCSVIKNAFASVQLPEFTPHQFRRTIGILGSDVCETMEELKAWSMNLGHESVATTVTSYMPVSEQRRREIFKGMK